MDSEAASFLRVQVWGLTISAAGFGMYAITIGYCFRAFFFSPKSRQRGISELDWPMLIIFLIFLSKATSALALHLYLNLEMATEDTRSQAALGFLDDPITMAEAATLLVQTVISSGVLVYRCWLIYGRAWLVAALPLALWLGAVGIMGVVINIEAQNQTSRIFAMSQSRSFGAAFWTTIITVNVITTVLIARRVWTVDNHHKSQPSIQTDTGHSTAKNSSGMICGQSQPHGIVNQATRIIVESGLIYTIMTLITFVIYVSNPIAVNAANDLLVQVTGISFNLFIIRDHSQSDSDDHMNHSVPLDFVSSNISVPGSAIEFAYPKRFVPRRKNRQDKQPSQDDVTLSVTEIPHTRSQQSV